MKCARVRRRVSCVADDWDWQPGGWQQLTTAAKSEGGEGREKDARRARHFLGGVSCAARKYLRRRRHFFGRRDNQVLTLHQMVQSTHPCILVI